MRSFDSILLNYILNWFPHQTDSSKGLLSACLKWNNVEQAGVEANCGEAQENRKF